MFAASLRKATSSQLGATLVPAACIFALQLVFFPMPIGVFVRGVIVGGITSLLALGMALIYRSNRIINFAQGDLGVAPAVLAYLLLSHHHWPYPVAVVVGGISAFALGGLVEVLFIRRFARAPRLVLTVATIGIAQVLTGLAILMPGWFNTELLAPRIPDPIKVDIVIGQTHLLGNTVIAVLAAPLAVLALIWFLRGTRYGTAVRAVADRADRAALLGVPVNRVQTLVWATAGLLAFVATFLRAGILGLPVGSALGLGLLLRSLTALLLGRMTNLPAIGLAATALGVLEQGVLWNGLPFGLGGEGNASVLDPLLAVIILVALLLGRNRSARTELDDQSSWESAHDPRPIDPKMARNKQVRTTRTVALSLLLLGAIAVPNILPVDKSLKASALLIYAMLALSVVVLTGWAGQVSLGQVAFFAIGSAVGAKLILAWGVDLLATMLITGVVGAAAAIIVGLPALRFRGLYLAVTSLAFALATTSFLLNRAFFDWVPTDRVERQPLFGKLDISTPTKVYYVALFFLIATILAVRGIRHSRTGRVLVALRENERAAQAYGVSAVRAKLTAFAMSGFIASAAGTLFVFHQQAFGDLPYRPQENLTIFTMVVFGGVATWPGALLGALWFQGIRWFLPIDWQFLASGFGVLFVLMVLPGGLSSLMISVRDRWLDLVSRHWRPSDVPPPPPTPFMPSAHVKATNGTTPVLEVERLEVAYGNVQVLFGVDLAVTRGHVAALLGTNGAGKSTLLNAMSGLTPVRDGSVRLEGETITGRKPHEVAALGLAQVPGGRGIFPSLTVAENLEIAAWLVDSEHLPERRRVVEGIFPILATRRRETAGDLSGGQQQMLAIGMALLSRPKVLMIDELTLGLAPIVIAQLMPVIDELRRQGTTVLLVEQSVNVALEAADTAFFLEKGEVQFRGPVGALMESDVARAIFLADPSGQLPEFVTKSTVDVEAAPVLGVTEARVAFGGIRAVDDVTFEVWPGEIVGILGPNGAGKTTLFDLISGFTALDHGKVVLEGHEITGLSPDQRARLGLGRSFQDSKLFPGMTVDEAIAVALERWMLAKDPLSAALHLPRSYDTETWVHERVDELIELVGLEEHRRSFVRELSTGMRRIVDLAALLAHRPSVVLLDEPSSGVAQAEVEHLAPLLRRIGEQTGASLVVIEHDIGLLQQVSGRLIALDQGHVIAAGDPASVLGHPAVRESYLGPDAHHVRSETEIHQPAQGVVSHATQS